MKKSRLQSRPFRLSRRDGTMICLGALVMLAIFGVSILVKNMRTPLAPQSEKITIAWIPPTVKRWEKPIDAMAQRYNIDPNMLVIIMTMESGGDPRADSGYAYGLMQVTPATGQDIARKYLREPVTKYDLWDPETNIEFGAAYLAHLRDIFGTQVQGPSWDATVELVAAGYNGGPGAASSMVQGKGLTGTQTVVYSRDAYNMWRERHAPNSPTFDRWQERGGSNLLNAAKTP